MSERKFIIPEYGPFAGMRVVCSGSLVAMPFAATMLADFGAEVIQIERPGVGDTLWSGRLPNGLSIYVVPRPGFQKKHAMLAVNYGGATRSVCWRLSPRSTAKRFPQPGRRTPATSWPWPWS